MSLNKILASCAAAVLVLIACACNPVVDTQSEGAKIAKLNDDWAAAIRAKDAGKVAELHAEKSISMERGTPMFISKEEIRKENEKSFTGSLISESFQGSTDSVEVSKSGDFAWTCGLYNFNYNTPAGPMKFDGKTFTLWKKIEGQWKVIMDIGTEVNVSTAPHSSPSLVAEFVKIEEGWNEASFNRDAKALDLLLAAEYTYFDDIVGLQDKKQSIAEITSGNYKFSSKSVVNDISVNLYDNVAVVKGQNAIKGTYKGKNISGNYRFVDIFVWRDGRWQCVSTK
jgi:ketosteroid isomerase-like protein